jgi:hypothetical protein
MNERRVLCDSAPLSSKERDPLGFKPPLKTECSFLISSQIVISREMPCLPTSEHFIHLRCQRLLGAADLKLELIIQ